MKLTNGLVINDRYVLSRQIAVGGMGEMWVAKDLILSRDVAIKAMREEHAGNEDFLQRLRTEAKNNAALQHPNIVALHDYYEQAKIGFIIQEYIDGENLGSILHKTPIMPLTELIPILSQIARALAYAHKNGIIHRDVKPANILVQKDGVVKVVDFGVSRAVDQTNMTQAGMVVGTAQYLSPEQAIGESAIAQSDIYALGVIAYEASVGKRPFGGKNAVDIAIAQVNSPVPAMPESIEPRFVKLVMQMLEKSSKNRPVDADLVADELDKIASMLGGVDIPFKPNKQNADSSSRIQSVPKLAPNKHLGTSKFAPSYKPSNSRPPRSHSHSARSTSALTNSNSNKNRLVDSKRTTASHKAALSSPNSYTAKAVRLVQSNNQSNGQHRYSKKQRRIDRNLIILGITIFFVLAILLFLISNISNF